MIRRGFGSLFALLLLAGVAGCEGSEIVIFSPAEGGSAGSSTGAAGIAAGGAPGGSGGLLDSGGSGGAASGSGGSGGSTDKPCRTNDDCDSSSWYCQKQNCGDPSGVCLPSPIFEDSQLLPVCGCDDHITYWNDTLRKIYGISASLPGACMSGARQCFSSDECGLDGTCAHQLRSFNDCGASGTGQCWIIPNDCGTDDKQEFVPCPPPGPPGSTPMCPAILTLCQALQSGQPFVRVRTAPQCP